MKVKRMEITEVLKRIWLFSANKIKTSESVSKQSTQLIVELISSLRHIIVTIIAADIRHTYLVLELQYHNTLHCHFSHIFFFHEPILF